VRSATSSVLDSMEATQVTLGLAGLMCFSISDRFPMWSDHPVILA
jgi:hypothetical protein